MKKLLLLCFVVLFSACEPEKNIELNRIEVTVPKQIQKVISFAEFTNSHKKALKSYKNFENISKKAIYLGDTLKIKTNKINYFEYYNYHSFTFELKRKGEKKGLENLLISLQKDGSYRTYIVSYDIDFLETVQILNQEKNLDFSSKMKFTEIELDASSINLSKSSLSNAINDCPSGNCCAITAETSMATGWTIYVASIIPCPDGLSDEGTTTIQVNSTGYSYPETEYTNPYNGGGGSDGGSTSTEPGGFCPDMSCEPNVTIPTVDPSIETATQVEKVQVLDDLINMNLQEKNFLSQPSKDALLTSLIYFIYINGEILKSKDFANGIIGLEMLVNESNYEISSTGTYMPEIEDCCPGDCCPDPQLYANDQIILTQYGLDIIQDAVDGTFNLIVASSELFGSQEWVGSRVRKIMNEIGMIVPDDVDNASLGELFQIRKRNGLVTVEYRPGFVGTMIDIGIDTFDIFALISPTRGGGAFLAARGGGKISKSVLSDYLKVLARGNWETVNESMSAAAKSYQEFISGRKWNESFVLDNTKFDGLRDGVLSDAKSGMTNFVDQSTGKFYGWFETSSTGGQGLIDQAQRQIIAAKGNPIEWHFQYSEVRDAVKKLFEGLPINIKLKYTPY